MNEKIRIDDYEIGVQKNFDLLDFLKFQNDNNFNPKLEEYHHSLFYPILNYSVKCINSSKDLEKIKLKVGLDSEKRIYIVVGREMYDLFFTEKSDKIDEVEIEFNFGKNDFYLKSIKERNEKEINLFKKYYEINSEDEEKICENEEEEIVEQFIQNKKKAIISRFLKGYSHQESILKAFESKIIGKYTNLPNLIFKKKNNTGKTIEEIDQIYYLNLEQTNQIIDGFDYFFYVKYEKGKEIEQKIFSNGNKFKLTNNNIYFLEIKQSIRGLEKEFEKLKKTQINDSKSGSLKFKREELTGIGNTILTFDIFHKLIQEITNEKNQECNILYIVNSDFEENMINIFQNCLKRDEKVINKELSFNLYLIYTQPDLALKCFVEENWKKKIK